MHKTNYALQYAGWKGSSVRKTLWACTNHFDEFRESMKKERLSDDLPNFDFFVMKNKGSGGMFYEVSFANDVKALFQALDEEELYNEIVHLKRHKTLEIDEDPISISTSDIQKLYIGQMDYCKEDKEWVFIFSPFNVTKGGRRFPGTNITEMIYLEVYHPNGFIEVW